MKKLIDLAYHCNEGACNIVGLSNAFNTALKELAEKHQTNRFKDIVKDDPVMFAAFDCILGQFSWLLGTGIGPKKTESIDLIEAEYKKIKGI